MPGDARINNVVFVDHNGPADPRPRIGFVFAQFSDGSTRSVCAYYTDEISFRADEFIGLTEAEARALHHQKDKEYLQS